MIHEYNVFSYDKLYAYEVRWKKVYPVMYNRQNTLIDLIFYWLVIQLAIILMNVILVHYRVSRYKNCTLSYKYNY